MIIALFPNLLKPQAKSLAIGIREFLEGQSVTVVADDKEAIELGAKPLSSCDPAKIDFIISMGGDGTILRIFHRYKEIQAPIIGINIGSLGFLAHIPVSEVYPSLNDILAGKYTVQERLLIEGETVKQEKCFAVNEIVIHRGKNACLIDLAVHVDGIYLNTFSADGIIVSAPSGSTAYSLSAGGPILTPELSALVITPICPHSISNKPIVLMPKKEIQIQYLSEYEPVEIIYDGLCNLSMNTGEVFRIKESLRRFKLVNLANHDYFSTLRSKLNWTGSLKENR